MGSEWEKIRSEFIAALADLEEKQNTNDRKRIQKVFDDLGPINIKFLTACAESYGSTLSCASPGKSNTAS
jgi:hypothetical protein